MDRHALRYPVYKIERLPISPAGKWAQRACTGLILADPASGDATMLSLDSIWAICHSLPSANVVISGYRGFDPLGVRDFDSLSRCLDSDHRSLVITPCSVGTVPVSASTIQWRFDGGRYQARLACQAHEMVYVLSERNPMEGVWDAMAHLRMGTPVHVMPASPAFHGEAWSFVELNSDFFFAPAA